MTVTAAKVNRLWIADHDPLRVVGHPTVGYDPCGPYAETFWLSQIGPSSLWLLRRLVRAVRTPSAVPDGVDIPLEPLSAELGLGRGTGASSQVVHSLDRLVSFRLAVIVDNRYRVNVAVPRLSDRQVERLPPHLRAIHPRAVHPRAVDVGQAS